MSLFYSDFFLDDVTPILLAGIGTPLRPLLITNLSDGLIFLARTSDVESSTAITLGSYESVTIYDHDPVYALGEQLGATCSLASQTDTNNVVTPPVVSSMLHSSFFAFGLLGAATN